ncbi:hypothetical protein [Tianweitania sediminis]|uniref:Glycosyltransferase RgtA/B/C/D-like domain-containing protein n=1 Tax=Tianweitania sediminis TaxID=1502156 RepID=A0A8J7RLZ4_9HYPH|nr:hypothetical protein [Tianweitania sediminis]MBP0439626.1 hypothetical protein [Tianweitania sediminis]
MSDVATSSAYRSMRKWTAIGTEWAATPKLYERLGISLMVAVVLLLSIATWLRPGYNWDMLAYVATALENRIDDPVELHAQTWSEVEKGANEHDLYLLRESQPYNLHQWENPTDFVTQLPFYRVKAAYIAALRLLEPVTGLDKAAILLSILPSLLFAAFCLYWLKREDALQGALVLVPVLGLADYLHMTTLATPDMIVSLLLVVATYLLLRKRDLAACLLLLAAVFFRPDTLIQIFAVLIAAVLFGWRKTPFIVTFAAAFVACLALSRYGEHPGWWVHFYFSTVEIQNTLTGFDPDFSIMAMAQGYARGILKTLTNENWAELLLLAIAGWRLLSISGKAKGSRFHGLMFALVIATLGKFASFPLPEARIYFPCVAAMALLLISAWKPRFEHGGPAASSTRQSQG